MAELGFTNLEYGSWAGIYAPAGTSDENALHIYNAVKYALSDPETVQRLNDIGLIAGLNESPEAFVDFLHQERARLKEAVEKYQISLD